MSRTQGVFRNWVIPPLPPGVREDYCINAAMQLQRLSRWLYGAMLVIVPFAIFVTPEDSGTVARWGLPLLMGAISLLGLSMLLRDHDFPNHPRRAERFLRSGVWFSLLGAVVCTGWAVLAWLGAEPGDRLHIPVILAMGALATSYCMVSLRTVALVHLCIDLIPVTALLMATGQGPEIAVAVSIIVCALFQWMMIAAMQDQVIAMLHLQRQSLHLASTDPLTGLANRRALLDAAQGMAPGTEARLLLIDIDHFKTINDRHGHECGDHVLGALGRLLAEQVAGSSAIAARLGGEEFALLGPVEALPERFAEALLAAIRGHAFPHDEPLRASIGVARGPTGSDEAWSLLYRRADEALYRAKAGGRDRAVEAGGQGDSADPLAPPLAEPAVPAAPGFPAHPAPLAHAAR